MHTWMCNTIFNQRYQVWFVSVYVKLIEKVIWRDLILTTKWTVADFVWSEVLKPENRILNWQGTLAVVSLHEHLRLHLAPAYHIKGGTNSSSEFSL